MNEQERMEQLFRQRQPAVQIQRPEPPPEPMRPVPQSVPKSPLTDPQTQLEIQRLSLEPKTEVILTDIRLSWTCVARLALQFVLMSFLVAAFLSGIVAIIAGVFMGLAGSLHTMPPPPIR